jgi:hypothetical protein
MIRLPLLLLACLSLGLAGCAGDRIAGPARTIGRDVSGLSSNLSRLQDGLTEYQETTAIRTDGLAARAEVALAAARQRQTEWKLVDADDTTAALDALMAQSRAEAARLAAPAPEPTAKPKAELPVKALAGVAKSVDEVGRPRTRREELLGLIAYGRDVNDQLAKLDDKVGAKPPAK